MTTNNTTLTLTQEEYNIVLTALILAEKATKERKNFLLSLQCAQLYEQITKQVYDNNLKDLANNSLSKYEQRLKDIEQMEKWKE